MDIKFDFNDVLLQPAIYSEVESRKTINVFDENNKLPLMTAPMDTVINEKNYELFDKLGYQLVFPRTLRFSRIRDIDPNWEYYFENCFFSIGLDEFKDMVKSSHKKSCEIVNLPLPKKILVDIANGHMSILKELAIKFKELYPDKMLMLGNIANPKTYKYFAETGCVDYLRVGIGNGGGCWVDGTLIKTIDGYKDIKDVEINDEVLTHDNTYQQVTNKISYIDDSEFLIRVNDDICTENHKLFVVDIVDEEKINNENYLDYGYWVTAKQIDSTKHLIVSLDDNV